MPSRVGAESTAHQLKITLRGTKPPVWRRLVVPSSTSLGCLHELVQRAFGWEFAHLHVFEDELWCEYGDPSVDSDMWGPPRRDEESVALSEVLPHERARLDYTYDFGDDWEHRIVVEKLLPADGVDVARCIGGGRANPPGEDIGGLWGMHELLELVADPALEPPAHLAAWVADLRECGYDPAAFDAAGTLGQALRCAARWQRHCLPASRTTKQLRSCAQPRLQQPMAASTWRSSL